MAKTDYLSSKQAAEVIGLSNETMHALEKLGKGPPVCRKGTRPYHYEDVVKYRDSLPSNLNDLVGTSPDLKFAEDDYGIWRRIVTYDEAYRRGSKRYFDGQRCRGGHAAERITKKMHCVSCLEAMPRRTYWWERRGQ